MKLFDPKTYRHRQSRLISNIENGIIWILGNDESPKNYRDNTFHFRQDSHFLYYGGISLPGLWLLIDVNDGRTYLCGDNPSIQDIIWTGPTKSIHEMAQLVGINHVLTIEEGRQFLKQARDKQRKVHYTPPYRGDNQIQIGEALGLTPTQVMKEFSRPLVEAIITQRSIKEEVEVDQIEQALAISKAMHLEVMYETKPDLFESDLVAKLQSVAVKNRVDTAYPVILTVNGQTLHNHTHYNKMERGQLLLGDFGAESEMFYASDITRTIPVGDHLSTQQEEIYRLVLSMLTCATDALSPGVPYLKIHQKSAEILAAGMVELGLMRGDPEEIVNAGAHALFFPHGLGHMMGLDVHDMEDLGEDLVGYDEDTIRSDQFGTRSLRLGRALQPGFVLTVEPGIYFIEELIDQWQASGLHSAYINYPKLDQYRNFGGIRIEDNYVITEKGGRLLGETIPKTVEEISFLRSIDKYTEQNIVD